MQLCVIAFLTDFRREIETVRIASLHSELLARARIDKIIQLPEQPNITRMKKTVRPVPETYLISIRMTDRDARAEEVLISDHTVDAASRSGSSVKTTKFN